MSADNPPMSERIVPAQLVMDRMADQRNSALNALAISDALNAALSAELDAAHARVAALEGAKSDAPATLGG